MARATQGLLGPDDPATAANNRLPLYTARIVRNGHASSLPHVIKLLGQGAPRAVDGTNSCLKGHVTVADRLLASRAMAIEVVDYDGRYAVLKRGLAIRYETSADYTWAKTDLIQE